MLEVTNNNPAELKKALQDAWHEWLLNRPVYLHKGREGVSVKKFKDLFIGSLHADDFVVYKVKHGTDTIIGRCDVSDETEIDSFTAIIR